MNGSCHCGRVTIGVPGTPDYLNACNCTLCTKMSGLWGYFPRSRVAIAGDTRAYVRDDIDAYLATHFCEHCGTTTHWSPLAEDAPDRMGVNMRLFDPASLTGVEVRYCDMRNDYDGPRRFYREPTRYGETETA